MAENEERWAIKLNLSLNRLFTVSLAAEARVCFVIKTNRPFYAGM
jgi:hypothetical protein